MNFEGGRGRVFCMGAGWKDEEGRRDLGHGRRPLFGLMGVGECRCAWFSNKKRKAARGVTARPG